MKLEGRCESLVIKPQRGTALLWDLEAALLVGLYAALLIGLYAALLIGLYAALLPGLLNTCPADHSTLVVP